MCGQQLCYSSHLYPQPNNGIIPRCKLCLALSPRQACCPPALTPEGFPSSPGLPCQSNFFKNGLLSTLANHREPPSEKHLLANPTPSHRRLGQALYQSPLEGSCLWLLALNSPQCWDRKAYCLPSQFKSQSRADYFSEIL